MLVRNNKTFQPFRFEGSRRFYQTCFFLLFLLISACASKNDSLQKNCPEIPEGLLVTERELTYIAALRAHHLAADIWEEKTNFEKAYQEMQEAMKLPRPEGIVCEEQFLDVATRATVLLNKRNLPEEAIRLSKEAEATASKDSLYLGALKMEQGKAYDKLGQSLREQEKTKEAQEQDLNAIDAYEASQEINGRYLLHLEEKLEKEKLDEKNP